jgi:hypothetical protein
MSYVFFVHSSTDRYEFKLMDEHRKKNAERFDKTKIDSAE